MTGAARRMTWLHFFCGKRNASDTWSVKKSQNALVLARPPALHSTFSICEESFEGSLAESRIIASR